MAYKSKSSSKRHRDHARQTRKEDDQVYLITGASESLIADSERKNRLYAVMIGVRIASLFVVLFTDGWVQLAVFVGGMLAPWRSEERRVGKVCRSRCMRCSSWNKVMCESYNSS